MKKRKLITMALSFLLTIGMVSAGFAAWVISAPTVKEATGTVSVDTVTDKRIKLTVIEDAEGKLPVVFGAKIEGTDSNGWLSLTDDAKTEDLVSEFSFTIDNQQDLWNAGVKKINIAFALNTDELSSYVTDNYITLPTFDEPAVSVNNNLTANGESNNKYFTINLENSSEKITVTVKYTFGWGQKFGSVNPYEYFSDKTDPNEKVSDIEKDIVWADYAFETLKKVEELNNETFKITVTATVVENETQS